MNPALREKIQRFGLVLVAFPIEGGIIWTAGQTEEGSAFGAQTTLRMKQCGAGLTPGEAVNSWCAKHNQLKKRSR